MELRTAVVGLLQTNAYILISKPAHNLCAEGIIIDPGGEPDKILSHTRGVSVKYILLTHNHPDHIEAVEPLKRELKVKCGIHTLDKVEKEFDFEFIDGDEIKLGDESLKVIHTPGHTPGSCCFLVGEYLFSGDTLFSCGYGRTDLPGGNEADLFRSIEKILKLPPNTKVYPGHGPPTTIANEIAFYLPFLKSFKFESSQK